MKLICFFCIAITALFIACKPISDNQSEKLMFSTNIQGSGQTIEFSLVQGSSYSHPLLAVWIEDTAGRYLQSLYVSRSIATGFFAHGTTESGKWSPGPRRRPAALPYWAFKRNVKEADGLFVPTPETPMPDAYTGPTPLKSFVLTSRADQPIKQPFRIMLEINQAFDWNRVWTTTRYPGDVHYSTSGQPSLVYATDFISPEARSRDFPLRLIGHGHHAGSSGQLFTDVSGHTTALEIIRSAVVSVK